MQAVVLYSLLVLVTLVSMATSFQCYVCSSKTSSNCGVGSDVDHKYLVDCDKANKTLGGGVKGAHWSVCRKIVTWVDFDVNTNKAEERVLRRCGHDKEKNANTCNYRGGLGGRQQVCSCETEGCNSAPGFKTAVALTSASVTSLLVVILTKTIY